MMTRYSLLALGLLPLLATSSVAQPVQPPPAAPPTNAPPAPAPVAPAPAPVAPAPAPAPAPAAPAPAAPAPAPVAPVAPVAAPVAPAPAPRAAPAAEAPLPPSFAAPGTPAATVSDSAAPATDISMSEVPPEKGGDGIPSLSGSIGLLRTSAAEVGVAGQLRFGLAGEYFSSSDFLIDGDRNLRLGGGVVVGFTPVNFLEIFAGVSGQSNRNRRVCATGVSGEMCISEPGRNDPEVIKSYGDITLGSKFAYPLSNGLSAGGELGLRFLSSVAGLAFDPSATSVWLTGLASWDMRTSYNLPMKVHFNLGLYFDNSAEVQNYKGISRPSQAVSQFAYGIGKDRVRTALGVEWPIENVAEGLALKPFAEYHVELVTADADPAFMDYRPPLCKGSSASAGTTPCRDNKDQQWITLGLRAQVKGGFAVGAGVDVAVHSVGFPYGAPLPPYNLLLALSAPLEFGPRKMMTKTVTVEKPVQVEKKVEAPKEAFVSGKVISANGGAPVDNAIVAVAGRTKARVATDPDGTFRSAGVPPGPVELEVSAPNFQAASVKTEVILGRETPVMVTLTPKVTKAKVAGRILDQAGKPLPATVRFSGAENAEAKTDEAGAFSTQLAAGQYTVHIEADSKHVPKDLQLALEQGADKDLNEQLRMRSTSTRVSVKNGTIVIRAGVGFKGGAAPTDLAPASQAVLDEVADALATHPEIKRLRVIAHWDSSLPADKAKALTEQQARAIAAYLAKQGVDQARIEAIGMGAEKPIVPNIGAAKFRNRRVEFRAVN